MAAPRNDNVKEKILGAAAELLEHKPFAAISLAEIAAASGVSKGTLYYHYRTKTDILFGITDRYLDRQRDELELWTENRAKDTSVHRLVRYVVERNTASAGIRIHLIHAAMLGDETLRTELLGRYRAFAEQIAEKLAPRVCGMAPEYLARLILLASDGLIVQQALRNGEFDAAAFLEQSASYLRILEPRAADRADGAP